MATALGGWPAATGSPYHEGANRGWRAGLALLPDRRAGIVVLANGDGGSAPIDAVVQQWVALATASPKHTWLRTVALRILTVAVVALGLTVSRTRQPNPPHKGRWRGFSSSRPSNAGAPKQVLDRHDVGVYQQAIERPGRPPGKLSP